MRIFAVVVVILIVFVALPILFGQYSMFGRSNWPSRFQSNGEQIYFTASSASGLAINARGGNMHMGMMSNSGCATCHGADRQGGRLMPNFWKSAPPLTPEALFEGHEEDGHGDHGEYSDEALRRAITMGIDGGGKPLDQAMPQWSMSKSDLDDLIVFLKTPTRDKTD